MTHPLSGKWILHYFHGEVPWQTLSDLPEGEALAINSRTGKTSGRFCPDTGRDLIYRIRLEIEAWDRAQHIARGGRMDNLNPVYALLSDLENPEHRHRGGNRIAIPGESVPVELMSLSFGDSFPNYDCRHRTDLAKIGSPHGRTYGPAELASILKQKPEFGTGWQAGYTGRERFCIEVRLYTRDLPHPRRPLQNCHSLRDGTTGLVVRHDI